MMQRGVPRTPLRARATLQVSTAAQIVLSFVVASWAVLILYREHKETTAARSGTRMVVKVTYGAEVTVSWADLDARKRTGWFGAPPEYSVAVRGAGGHVEQTHCARVRDTSCVLGKLKPCGQYEVAVTVVSDVPRSRRWRRFAVPASSAREEVLCKGGWTPMLGGFALENGALIMGSAVASAGSLASLGGASQLAEVVGESPVTLLRLTLRHRAARPDDGASSVQVELWHRDGSRSREVRVSLEHGDTEWRTQTALIAVDSQHTLTAVRVAIVTVGFFRFETVSLKRVLRGEALLRPPPAPPPGTAPALRVRSFQALFGARRGMVGVSVALVAGRLAELVQLVQHWNGPVAAAVWVVEPEDEHAIEQAKLKHALVREWVDFHYVERDGASRYSLEKMRAAVPMNALRNLAVARSRVRLVLELDVEMVPCVWCRGQLEALAASVEGAWRAVVVPAFELADSEAVLAVPEHRDELLQLVEERSVRQHRVTTTPLAHAATDYNQWFDCQSEYAAVPATGWEPFLLLDKEQAPPWDERLLAGTFDRASRAESLSALEFEFVVSSQAFVMSASNNVAPGPLNIHAATLYASFQAELRRHVAK